MIKKGIDKSKEAFLKAREGFRKHVGPYMPEPTEPWWKRTLAWGVLWGAIGFLAFLILFTFSIVVLSLGLPDVRNFSELAGAESTIIFDRDGGILYTIHGEENRKYVPLEEISPFLQKATIAIEDKEFYEHVGFDLPAIAKGLVHELTGIGVRRGGSTITQQLAKNAFLKPERSYVRKIRELILAIRLERAYDKNKILELYLNRIPYGNNAYGAELASQIYFGKSAKDLTLGEAIILSSLPNAPTFYSPYGEFAYSKLNREFDLKTLEQRNIQSLSDLKDDEFTIGLIGKEIQLTDTSILYLPGRTDVVLKRLADLGHIEEAEKSAALKEIHNIEFQRYRANIKAAHFVFYIRTLLEAKYGKEAVEQGGLHVYTPIDPKLQTLAEDLIAKQAEVNQKNVKTQNMALVSASVETGEVLAMVGSSDYFNDDIQGKVNNVFAYRQPGSSFKPFVYAKAFLNGYSPATVIYDTPTDFGGDYKPKNFEGLFKGPLPIRRALGQSRNIPAIKTYFLAGQEDEIAKFAENVGVSGLAARKPDLGYGPALGIGSGEVRMIDMIQGFMTFAAMGKKKDLVYITKVEDRDGKILEEWEPKDVTEKDALDPQVAYLINHILADQSVNLGQRLNVPGHKVSVKTGTSTKELPNKTEVPSNLWTFGYTSKIVTGAWAGNTNGSALGQAAEAYTNVAPVWNSFMQEALKDMPDEFYKEPEGIKHVTVSKASGRLPSSTTPENQQVTEIFASFNVPTEFDDMFTELEVNEVDFLLPNEYTPKERVIKKLFMNHHDPITTYFSWLAGIKLWVAAEQEKNPDYPGFPPTEKTDIFKEEHVGKEPRINILNPAPYTVFGDGTIDVEVEFDVPLGFDRLEFYLDDHHQFTAREPTKPGKIRIISFVTEGKHLIVAKVFDKVGFVGIAQIEMRVSREEPVPVGADMSEGQEPAPPEGTRPAAPEEALPAL